jgi:hypothetical protein
MILKRLMTTKGQLLVSLHILLSSDEYMYVLCNFTKGKVVIGAGYPHGVQLSFAKRCVIRSHLHFCSNYACNNYSASTIQRPRLRRRQLQQHKLDNTSSKNGNDKTTRTLNISDYFCSNYDDDPRLLLQSTMSMLTATTTNTTTKTTMKSVTKSTTIHQKRQL